MPKEKQGRTPTRRAASKEALKQMHILLGDEKKYEISSDDDDVIEVDVQPPKKKYKLSHRKSADGNDRDVIVLKTVTKDESVFDLDVTVEDLAPAQKSRLELMQKEDKEIETKIEELLKAPNTEVIYNGICTTAVEITEQLQNVIGGVAAPVPGQSIVLQQSTPANSGVPQSYQLVMDPRLGVIVGAVSTPNATSAPPLLYQQKVTTVPPTPEAPKTRRATALRTAQNNTPAASPMQKTQKATPPPKVNTPKGLQVKPVLRQVQVKTPVQVKAPPPKTNVKLGRTNLTPQTPPFRPTETNVEGGLAMGTRSQKSIDLTLGDDGKALPDSREVSFNKLQGRTYPSLVVVARPHLRVKDLTTDRGKLDIKVKSVLMYPPTKFTEWLIQQGLVRSDQKCSVHSSNALKLGMYSDASKFPYSGGYVWISECCPQRFVSVFSGSIFEGSQHPPMAILKLLYHWCCQTIVQNVTQWVKVDNLFVKGMYTVLRSVCTVALHTHIKQLGGPGVKVQVGVISLGTTSQDGNKREVKVEVLGILETASRHIRLRAVEPLAEGERNYKKRFNKILEPVFTWVHPASIIVTDLTVDKGTLHQMGFVNVIQSTSTDYTNSNRTIMEYLRKIVPRMFQNTLSLLSRQIIQQFLDELVWREWYGTSVLQCFDNMIQHISDQTRSDYGQALIVRLNKVSLNPFKNWALQANTANNNNFTQPTIAPKTVTEQPTVKRPYNRGRKPVAAPPPQITVSQDIMRPAKSTSPDVPEKMVPLENYYYGVINQIQQTNKVCVTLNIKCPFCKFTFNSNISLMNHLFKHAHNVSDDVQLCKYCLTIVPSAHDLLKHISTAHPDETKFDNNFICLICESQFRNPFILGKHMSREHCPSELPYMCGTCEFRCSNHKQAVDHFYTQHENGTTIQCPFCLKSTTIYAGGRNISQNMNYFIQHLQKHQKKQLAKRCGRCTLWFIQKDFLKDHQTKMHISQRGKHGLVPCFAPRNGVMVPKSRMDKCPDDAKIINFSTLYFNLGKNLNCKECNKTLNNPKHFSSFESCQNPNCQFSTCCSDSMQEHVAKCKFLNSKLPTEKLPYEMFCVCGYSDTCGNLMAKHLAICERKSAYPSQEAAKAATATNSMLDVLGLVRKPEESSSGVDKDVLPPLVPIEKPPLKRGRPRKNKDVEKEGGDKAINEESEDPRTIAEDITDLTNIEDEPDNKGVPETIEIKDDDKESDDVRIIDDCKPESVNEKGSIDETKTEKVLEDRIDSESKSTSEKDLEVSRDQKNEAEKVLGDRIDKESKATSEKELEVSGDQMNEAEKVLDDRIDKESKSTSEKDLEVSGDQMNETESEKVLDGRIDSESNCTLKKDSEPELQAEAEDGRIDSESKSATEKDSEVSLDQVNEVENERIDSDSKSTIEKDSEVPGDQINDIENSESKSLTEKDSEVFDDPMNGTGNERIDSEPPIEKDPEVLGDQMNETESGEAKSLTEKDSEISGDQMNEIDGDSKPTSEKESDVCGDQMNDAETLLDERIASEAFELSNTYQQSDLSNHADDLLKEISDLAQACSDQLENNIEEPKERSEEKMDFDDSLNFDVDKPLESIDPAEEISLAVDDKIRDKALEDVDKVVEEICSMDTD